MTREYKHCLTLDEGERQAVLLALAHFSVERPGWLVLLEEIALRIDNKDKDGHAEMFEQFRLQTSNGVAEVLASDNPSHLLDPGIEWLPPSPPR